MIFMKSTYLHRSLRMSVKKISMNHRSKWKILLMQFSKSNGHETLFLLNLILRFKKSFQKWSFDLTMLISISSYLSNYTQRKEIKLPWRIELNKNLTQKFKLILNEQISLCLKNQKLLLKSNSSSFKRWYWTINLKNI